MGRGFARIEIFSVSIDLYEQKCGTLSCAVDAAGNFQPTGLGNLTFDSSQERLSSEHHDTVRLSGTILARQGYQHLLYDQVPEKPECVCVKDTISLKGPSKSLCALGVEIIFDLEDKNRGLQVSKGWFAYDANGPKAHFLKRLSAVVRGDHGCATLHYMLFPEAREAYVKVILYTNGDNGCSASQVFGNLVVSYGGHDYSTEYDKKYYRTTLFKQAMHDAVPLNGNAKVLPLSRSVIVSPVDTSLIFEAELYEMSGETKSAIVNGRVELPFQENGTASQEIPCENGHMVVTLRWCNTL